MATLGIPAYGYGIRYDHGLFRQVIKRRLAAGISRGLAVLRQPVGVRAAGGHLRHRLRRPRRDDHAGPAARRASVWHPDETIEAVAYDTPIVGWRGAHVNPLRLWSARAADPLRLDAFNTRRPCRRAVRAGARRGDLEVPLSERRDAGRPRAAAAAGIFLRLRLAAGPGARGICASTAICISLPQRAAIQLNDTHPSIAVAELMRLLVDVHGLPWDEAWQITVGTFSYTNHTLLPEALESWPVPLFERLLPRHMQIIYRINAEHLEARAARRSGLARRICRRSR